MIEALSNTIQKMICCTNRDFELWDLKRGVSISIVAMHSSVFDKITVAGLVNTRGETKQYNGDSVEEVLIQVVEDLIAMKSKVDFERQKEHGVNRPQ